MCTSTYYALLIATCVNLTIPTTGSAPDLKSMGIDSTAMLKLARNSPLTDRYNGGMLGTFLSGASHPLAAERFDFYRARCVEYLDQAGVPIVLPTDHDDFVKFYPELL